jgi:predicted lipoprotein with Yx(FWY)xxD motif
MRKHLGKATRLAIVYFLGLILMSASACSSGITNTATSPSATPNTPTPTVTTTPLPPTTTATIPDPYTLHVKSKTNIGNYLADPRGMTLYYTVSDHPDYSNLPDETLANWPVFYVSNIVVPPSLNIADFGTYTRDNNTKQTTYRGYPLYYFSQDKKTGDTFGNSLAGVWFVVNPDSFPPGP